MWAMPLLQIVVETIHDQQVSGMGFAALFGGFIIYFLFLYDKSLPSLKTYQRVSKALNCKYFLPILWQYTGGELKLT